MARLFGLNEEEVGGVKEALRVVINKNSNSLYIRNKLPHKMLTKIAIENFKSIGRRIELELKPLTILVGPNASGKSSILEALPLLIQSIGTSGYDYRGDNYPALVSYPSFEDIAHKRNSENKMSIEIHVKLDESERKTLSELGKEINKRKRSSPHFIVMLK